MSSGAPVHEVYEYRYLSNGAKTLFPIAN